MVDRPKERYSWKKRRLIKSIYIYIFFFFNGKMFKKERFPFGWVFRLHDPVINRIGIFKKCSAKLRENSKKATKFYLVTLVMVIRVKVLLCLQANICNQLVLIL